MILVFTTSAGVLMVAATKPLQALHKISKSLTLYTQMFILRNSSHGEFSMRDFCIMKQNLSHVHRRQIKIKLIHSSIYQLINQSVHQLINPSVSQWAIKSINLSTSWIIYIIHEYKMKQWRIQTANDRLIAVLTDEWMDGWMEGRKDGLTEWRIYCPIDWLIDQFDRLI